MKKNRIKKYLTAAGIAILLLFAFCFSKAEVSISGNDSGRFAVIQALAEQHVFHIEKTCFRTVDKKWHNNHFYFDKPLALSVAGAGIHAVNHKLFHLSFADNYYLCIYLVNLILGGVVNAAIFRCLFRLLRTLRGNIYLKFLIAFAAAAGSWLLSYSVVINNHTPAALLVLLLFCGMRHLPAELPDKKAFCLGLLAGGIGLLDIPGGLFFGFGTLAGVWLATKKLRSAALTAAGGALCVIAFALLNFIAYGSVIPLYLASDSGGSFHFGFNPLLGEYLWNTLCGSRGLFSYQPFTLAGVLGIVCLWRKIRQPERCIFISALIFVLFYVFATLEYGGAAYGFRYLIPVIPLLFYAGAKYLLQWKKKNAAAAVAVLLLIPGVISGLVGAYAPFCVANEGVHSKPGHFTNEIRSTFFGNLLCWSYDVSPDGAFTEYLLRQSPRNADLLFLYHSYWNLKRPDLLGRLKADRRMFP